MPGRNGKVYIYIYIFTYVYNYIIIQILIIISRYIPIDLCMYVLRHLEAAEMFECDYVLFLNAI